jgi:hypothetical protein
MGDNVTLVPKVRGISTAGEILARQDSLFRKFRQYKEQSFILKSYNITNCSVIPLPLSILL